MSLDNAQEAFRDEPGTTTAIEYATALIEYSGDGMIGNDTLRLGLIEIADGLTGGRCSMGGEVETIVRAV